MMSLKILIILTSLLSFWTWADCTMDGVSVKESERISLYDKGKSLEKFKSQDQAGLGICYAEAASVAISSALPNNPQVSALDLALQYSQKDRIDDVSKNASGKSGFMNPFFEKKIFIEYGDQCDALEAAKENGGVCPVEKMNIENSSLIENDPYKQEIIMRKLSLYFDSIFKDKQQNKAQFEGQMKEIADLIKNSREAKAQYCAQITSTKKDNQNWPEVGLESYLIELWGYSNNKEIKSEGECQSWVTKQLSKFLSNDNLTGDSINLQYQSGINLDFNSQVKNSIPTDQIFGDKSFSEWFASIEDEKRMALEKAYAQELKKFFFKKVNEPIPAFCKNSYLFMDSSFEGYGYFAFEKLGFSQGNKKSCEKYIEQQLIIDLWSDQPFQSECGENYFSLEVSRGIAPFVELNADIEKVTSILTSVDKASIEPFYDLLGPLCKENRVDLSNVNCKTFRAPPYRDTNDLNDRKWDLLMSSEVKNSITSNKAIMFSACTDILKKEPKESNYCTDISSSENMHAMTITGYRCEQGKIQYEVTNSWGNHCPLGSKNFKNSVIECQKHEVNENGKIRKELNGRMWIDSKYLSGNIADFETLN